MRTLIAALLGGASLAAAAQDAGQVQVVVGAAQLINTAGQQRPVERGAAIQQGDRIVTSDGALVQVKLSDGTFLSVRTDTDVTIEKVKHDEKAPAESSMLIRLARGALRSITGLIGSSNPSAYKVITPTATIGIRGTDHEPVFIPEPKPGETPLAPPGTYDKVNSGATMIQTGQGLVDIRPGQVGFVPVGAKEPPKLLPAVPEFFKRLDARSGDATGKQGRSPSDGKLLARPAVRPSVVSGDIKPVGTVEGAKLDSTVLSPTLSTSTKLEAVQTAPLVESTTLPKTTSTTTLSPTVTSSPLIAPTTTLSPASTTIAPATTTINTSTTLIQPKTTTNIILK